MTELLTRDEYGAIAAEIDLPATPFIDGRFQKGAGPMMETINPATGDLEVAPDGRDVRVVKGGDLLEQAVHLQLRDGAEEAVCAVRCDRVFPEVGQHMHVPFGADIDKGVSERSIGDGALTGTARGDNQVPTVAGRFHSRQQCLDTGGRPRCIGQKNYEATTLAELLTGRRCGSVFRGG